MMTERRLPQGSLHDVDGTEIPSLITNGASLSMLRFPIRWHWKPRVARLTMEDVDLNHPMISKPLLASGFLLDARFHRVNFGDVNAKRLRVEGCLFRRCVFSGIFLGTTFKGCRFEDCLMIDMSFKDCIFEHCALTDIEAKESQWERCQFERVKGTGVLEGVTIAKSKFVEVDWSPMRIVDSNNVENDFVRSRMPSRPDNFVINTSLLPDASSALKGKVSASGYEEYQKFARYYAKQSTDEFLDETMFRDLARDDRRIVMDVLYEKRDRRFE
jgi:hypothetical protein